MLTKLPYFASFLSLCYAFSLSLTLCPYLVLGVFFMIISSFLFQLPNRSLVKYRLIIEDFGGWSLFQKLLQVLSDLAAEIPPVILNKETVRVTIAMVAIAYVLDLPAVGGVILGSLDPR